jgi:hypothetical protein
MPPALYEFYFLKKKKCFNFSKGELPMVLLRDHLHLQSVLAKSVGDSNCACLGPFYFNATDNDIYNLLFHFTNLRVSFRRYIGDYRGVESPSTPILGELPIFLFYVG